MTTITLPNPDNKYTQLMPEMTPEQFKELKDDIKHKGVIEPLQVDADTNDMLDGRHRWKAWEELVMEGVDLPMPDCIRRRFSSEEAKVDYVLSLNVKRRHLTPEQRSQLVVKLRTMGLTMTKIGEMLQVNVGTISRDLASVSDEEKEQLKAAVIKSSDGREFAGDGYAPRVLFVTGQQTIARAQSVARGAEAGPTPTEQAKELASQWDVKPGDVWLIPSKNLPGKMHAVMCGSCLDPSAMNHLMHGNQARLAVTSPPYNQQISTFKPSGMQTENTAFVERMASAYADAKPEAEYQGEQLVMLDILRFHMTADGSFFYNHKNRIRNSEVISPLSWLLKQLDWKLRCEIVWDRGSSVTLNARMFVPCDERIYWLVKDPSNFYFVDTTEVKAWTTVWQFAARNEEHVSAPFPNELPHRCIVACSEVGDLVLDPYMGTGTTMAEAERLSRVCYGMEVKPEHVAVNLERMKKMGLEPRKI